MREILFRGKRRDNGEYVFGCYYKQSEFYGDEKEDHIIITTHEDLSYDQALDYYAVYPETVGQFTGLTDKNGKKIFERDIVKQTFEKTVAITTADLWDGDEYADLYGEDVGVVVILPSKGACIKNPVIHREVNGETVQDGETAKMYKNICSGRCEVIGNIHDHPELLEGAANG